NLRDARGQVPGDLPALGRTAAPPVDGRGSAGAGTWWYPGGSAGCRGTRSDCVAGSMSWTQARRRWVGSAARWGRKRATQLRSRAAPGIAGPGRAGGAGDPNVAAAVDDEVDPQAGR